MFHRYKFQGMLIKDRNTNNRKPNPRYRARKSRETLQRPTIFTRCDLDFLAPSTKRVPQQNESLHFSSGNGFTSTYGFGNKFVEIMSTL